MTKIEVRQEAMGLPKEERIALAMALWDSVEPDEIPPLTEAQIRLLDGRIKEYEANPDDVVPWDEVRDKALRSLRRA
jgi:putative addiction module component (TIGR02574 family)